MGRYYILRDREVVEEPDFEKWLQWHETSYEAVRCIASTGVKYGKVVTVFLGMDMSPSGSELPWLFDTRVQGGWLCNEWERASTLDEALAGHEALIARVREAETQHDTPPPDCPSW